MAGEWIAGKARGLMAQFFPGSWEEVQEGVFQGRCPGEHLHHGSNAATDCRIHVAYGAAGQPPGIYCLHKSCLGVLEPMNQAFREAIFARDENYRPARPVEEGVVKRAPVSREAWIPDFQIAKLRGLVLGVPPVGLEWFEERSVVDPRGVTPGEFIERAFQPGERVVVFTEFKGPGDYLWEVGRGGYRLSAERGVKAVKSRLPIDGGRDGVWYLCNPVDGLWHPNPRRAGRYSRRSMESVTAWRHMVLESDEEKLLRLKAAAVREALGKESPEERRAVLADCAGEKWADEVMQRPLEGLADELLADAAAMQGLWLRFLAMAPLAIKAIYSSGGQSWHALVEVNMATKLDFDAYLRNSAKRLLPLIGADPGAMTPVRLSRLPGCTRGGKLQRLIYLNPKPDGTPIRDQVRRREVPHV